MSRHTEKQFTNDATTPMIVSVAACIDDNGIVRDMHAAGGIVGQNDIQRAEAQRIHRWVRNTFVGQHEFFFNAHDGKVPEPSFKPARERRVGMPPELGMGYGLIESLFRDFIENVPFDGSEQPPAAGERYFSVISGGTYTVIDARRKQDSTDYYVTMERDGDGHRTKFTYRDHATWLATWRPADDEGNARKTVEVELRLDTKDASEALRSVGEQAHAAAEAMMDFREANAERQLNVIYRELDRKVPGWRNMGAHYENIDEVGLALRAIRSINKHMLNYQQIANTATTEVSKLSNKNRELSSLLSVRTRELDKLKQERGGAWDAARVRREQDTMRELLRHYALLFVRHYGRATLKRLLSELDAETLLGLPHEHFMLLVTRCEAHSDRQGG